jgi:hypothetical protein
MVTEDFVDAEGNADVERYCRERVDRMGKAYTPNTMR